MAKESPPERLESSPLRQAESPSPVRERNRLAPAVCNAPSPAASRSSAIHHPPRQAWVPPCPLDLPLLAPPPSRGLCTTTHCQPGSRGAESKRVISSGEETRVPINQQHAATSNCLACPEQPTSSLPRQQSGHLAPRDEPSAHATATSPRRAGRRGAFGGRQFVPDLFFQL